MWAANQTKRWATSLKSKGPVLALGALLLTGAQAPQDLNVQVREAWRLELGVLDLEQEPSDAAQLEAARTLLTGAPHSIVLAELNAVLGTTPEPAALRPALERLAERRESALLPKAAELLAGFDEAQLQHSATRSWIQSVVIRLSQDAHGSEIGRARELAPSSLEVAFDLAELNAGSERPLAVWTATQLSERALEERLEGLSSLPFLPDQAMARKALLVRMLNEDSDRVQARAAQGLGLLGATSEISELIRKTQDREGPKTRRAAQQALESLTGLEWAKDTGQWASWHGGELNWSADFLPDLAEALVGGEPAEHAGALRQLMQHPSSAHLFAADLARSAQEQSPELAAASLRSLAALPCAEARIELHSLVDFGPPEIRAAAKVAWEALPAGPLGP